jgi:hypothetical protein
MPTIPERIETATALLETKAATLAAAVDITATHASNAQAAAAQAAAALEEIQHTPSGGGGGGSGAVSSVAGHTGDVVLNKSDVGLDDVDNTSDANKPVSTPQGEAIAAAQSSVQSSVDAHILDKENPHDVTKAQVGLGNVDNTSDADKPVSTDTQAALDAKLGLSEKGSPNGVATLDELGKLAQSQLPELSALEQIEEQLDSLTSLLANVIARVFEPSAPSITVQPIGSNVAERGGISLSVTAKGFPFPTYQWRKGAFNIQGATSPTFTIQDSVPGDSGYYDVVVSNQLGSATSNSVAVVVLAENPTIATQGLFAEYDLSTATGSRVLNKARQTTPIGADNLMYKVGRYGSVAVAGTITKNYADKDGGTNAIRAQSIPDNSWMAQSNRPYLGAGPCTYSVWLRSNNGESFQVKIIADQFGASAPFTVPADGTWVRFVQSWNITSAGTIHIILISVGAINDASVYGFKLEAGSTATAYDANDDALIASNSCTVHSDGVYIGNGGGFLVSNAAPRSLTAFTSYSLVKWDATLTPNDSRYVGIWSSDLYDTSDANDHLSVSAAGATNINGALGSPTFRFGDTSTFISSKMSAVLDGNWHLVAARYNGSTVALFIDGMLVGQKAASSKTLSWSGQLLVGLSPGVWKGTLGYMSMYEVAHSDLEMKTEFAKYQAICISHANQLSAAGDFLVAEGDSITDGVGRKPYPALALDTMSGVVGNNFAVPGNRIEDIAARAAQVDSLVASGRKYVLSVMTGSNDFQYWGTLTGISPAAFVQKLKDYCLARRAAGWTVVVCTVLPHTGGSTHTAFNTWRDSVNTAIRADNSFYDVLCDWRVDAGLDTAPTSPDASLYVDYIHPSDACQARLAAVYKTAITYAFADTQI